MWARDRVGTVVLGGAIAAAVLSCEARPLAGSRSCAGTSCVGCHGGADNCTGAPPTDTRGRSETSLASVGAHSAHVEDGPLARAFDCTECHTTPTQLGSPGHRDGIVQVDFPGALARAGGLAPSFDGARCSSTYCHGATLGGGAGTLLAPSWTTVDGSQASCGRCHGLPPPAFPQAPSHPQLALGSDARTCAACHDETVRSDGLIDVPAGKHVNGAVDVRAEALHPSGWLNEGSRDFHGDFVEANGSSSCTRCHAINPPARVTAFTCSTCHGVGFRPP